MQSLLSMFEQGQTATEIPETRNSEVSIDQSSFYPMSGV
jgi:hypothetical protein